MKFDLFSFRNDLTLDMTDFMRKKNNRDFTLVWLVWFTHLLTRAEKNSGTYCYLGSYPYDAVAVLFYCPHFFLMLLKLSIFVSIVDCSQCFGFVSALLWLTHHMRLTNREILMAKFQPFVDWFTGWFAFSSLILFHSLHTLATIKQNVGIQCITQQIQCMAMVNKNVTIWHADLWMRKYLFMVQQTTNGSINNMRCTYFVFSFFFISFL